MKLENEISIDLTCFHFVSLGFWADGNRDKSMKNHTKCLKICHILRGKRLESVRYPCLESLLQPIFLCMDKVSKAGSLKLKDFCLVCFSTYVCPIFNCFIFVMSMCTRQGGEMNGP